MATKRKSEDQGEQLSYDQALAEIQGIVSEMEQGELPVDTLVEKVKRANFLLAFCKEQIRKSADSLSKLT